MRTGKERTLYHNRMNAEKIKEMEEMKQKKANEVKEMDTAELKLTKEQLKSLKAVLGGLDDYLIGHINKGELDEREVSKHIMSIYNRITDMEKGEE